MENAGDEGERTGNSSGALIGGLIASTIRSVAGFYIKRTWIQKACTHIKRTFSHSSRGDTGETFARVNANTAEEMQTCI